jgi:2-methylisocitrate lyase-like PEP mutase family enzyme
MKATAQLRGLLEEERCVVAGGCFDALSGLIAEAAGFKALHVTGFGVAATLLGSPDLNLTTMTEVVTHVGHITAAARVPVICDAEAGWGDVSNVTRTVREFERAEAAGIHLEDQTTPARGPGTGRRVLLPRAEAVGKVKAACAARTDPHFVIIARTDADEISFDEEVTRCNLYLEAGADFAMPVLAKFNGQPLREIPPDKQMELHRRLCREAKGPLLGLGIPAGYSSNDMIEAGYKIVILPTLSFQAAAGAMMAAMREAVVNGTAQQYFATAPQLPAADLARMLGLARYAEIEKKFRP